ncbi:MAG: hypothetical protein AB1611_08805 [bacterium]
MSKYHVSKGKILDPFAGSGTALFAGSILGYDADGIELLPVGQKIIEANIIARSHNKQEIAARLNHWISDTVWNKDGKAKDFEVLGITNGAYPKETEYKIKRYLYEIDNENPKIKELLLLALLCVLESISYTRKDGQYLRWDYRSGRRNGNNAFHKGKILSFDEAILSKLNEFLNDITKRYRQIDLFSSMNQDIKPGEIYLLKGSCLNLLPNIKSETYTAVITSPPYCNRYDYTRTYALEHALLGVNEEGLVALRQVIVII